MSEEYKAVLSRINGEDIADLTLDLVKIHSETGNEQEAQEFYADYLRRAGLEVSFQQVDPVDETWRYNVIGKIPGAGEGRSLMIHSHLDTIPWGDCVQPHYNREEGRVYGRGACDMKGQCALQAIAGKAIVESGVKLKGDLYIVGGVGEEGSSKPDGTRRKYGAQALVESGFHVDSAVVLECHQPLELALANKSSMGFRITVVGADRLMHESTVPFNRNSTFWQAEMIVALEKYNQELSKRKHLYAGPPYINVSAVTHQPAPSAVPMAVTIRGIRRVNPGEAKEAVRKELEDVVDSVRKRSPLKIESSVTGDPAPWEVSPDERVVKSFQKAFKTIMGKDVKLSGHPANADSRWFNKGATEWHRKYNPKVITTIAFGPDHNSLHSNLEHIAIEQSLTAAKVIALGALDFCEVI